MHPALTWDSPAHLPVVLTAAAACVAVAVTAYRPQLRRAGLFWRWTIPALRAAAIIALLASVLRPSILRPAAPDDLGAVAVLLDDSPSMSVTDASWTPAELVGLADALHALPPRAARWSPHDLDEHLARIRPLIDDAARAASEVEYARVAGRSADLPERRAAQTRAALIAACNALAARAPAEPPPLKPALSAWSEAAPIIDTRGRAAWADLRARAAATAKSIQSYQAESDARLYADNPAVRTACDRLAQMSRIDLARYTVERELLPALPPDVPVRVTLASTPDAPLVPTSSAGTRPSLPDVTADAATADLTATTLALAQPQQPHAPRIRSVLLFTDGRQPSAAPHPTTPAGAPPVIACLVAPSAVRDLSIRHIDVPPIAYTGDTSTVHVDLASTGFAASTPLAVHVTCDGAVVQSQQAKLDPAGRASVDLPVRFPRAGAAHLTIRVDPLPGEATAANNAADRYVRVLADRVPVIALTADTQDAANAARQLLSRVPGVTPHVAPATAAPSPADILHARVLILDDARADALTAEQLDALRELVTVRAGTLVLVAGRSNWPLDESSEALLDDFLPYRIFGRPLWWSSSGRTPTAAPDANVPPGLLNLPAPGTFLQLGALRASAHPLLIDPDTGSPWLTESPAGNGKVLTIATDSAIPPGDPAATTADPAPFWTALIRYVAEPPYAAASDGYALDTDRLDTDAGSPVHVRAKIPPASSGDPDSRPPSLLVLSSNRVVRAEPLTPTGPESDGRFSAALANLPPGDYVIRLDTGVDDELAPLLDVPLHVRPAADDDLADVSPNPSLLHHLADPTGGAVIPIADAARLAPAVLRGPPDRPQTVEYPLWESPYLFLFITACLTAEWALRKRLGLA